MYGMVYIYYIQMFGVGMFLCKIFYKYIFLKVSYVHQEQDYSKITNIVNIVLFLNTF